MPNERTLPEVTQAPVLFVDNTPNEDLPLRILRAYREDCNCQWRADPPNALVDMMNEHCQQRAAILDKAIAVLERDKMKYRREVSTKEA